MVDFRWGTTRSGYVTSGANDRVANSPSPYIHRVALGIRARMGNTSCTTSIVCGRYQDGHAHPDIISVCLLFTPLLSVLICDLFIDSGQDAARRPTGLCKYSVYLLATDLFVVFMIFSGKRSVRSRFENKAREGAQEELNNKNEATVEQHRWPSG